MCIYKYKVIQVHIYNIYIHNISIYIQIYREKRLVHHINVRINIHSSAFTSSITIDLQKVVI